MKCYKCGKTLQDNSEFCSYCGQKLDNEFEIRDLKNDEKKEQVNEKETKKKTYGIVAIFAIIILIFFAIVISGKDESEVEEDSEDWGAENTIEEDEKEIVDYLDLEALKELEEKNDFEVQIVDTFLEHHSEIAVKEDEEDIFRFTVLNESGETISEFTIYTIAYTEAEQKVQLCREGFTVGADKIMAYSYGGIEEFFSGTTYEEIKRCNLDDFYNVKVLIGDYTTDDGTYHENPILDEWMDIVDYGSGEGGEESFSGPNPDEYSEIILNDKRYYLCSKVESDFDTDAIYYGIYDAELEEWTVDFTELSESDEVLEFENLGDGVFSYCSDFYYSMYDFISSDLGGSFSLELKSGISDIKFVDGEAHVVIPNDVYGERPDHFMVKLNTYGEIEKLSLQEFENEKLYWAYSTVMTPKTNEDLYAKSFSTEGDGKYLYIYLYDTEEYIIIYEQEYTTRLTEVMGESNKNSSVYLKDDIICIDKLEGDDGNLYYVEYDKDGNLVTEPTSMP